MRNAPDRLFGLALWGAALGVAAVFAWLFADIARLGVDALSWDLLTTAPENAGRGGGIAPIIVSTLLILGVAVGVAAPVGLGTAVWLNTYTRAGGPAGRRIRLALDGLAGMPSIIFGLFGNAFFSVYLGFGFSILSGGLTLAAMILPIFIRTVEAGLGAVDDSWRRGAAALGLTQSAALAHVILPAAAPAIGAGLLLGIGRAAAETAALIFTSGYVDRMPESLSDSGRALAVHIYDLSMNVPGGDAHAAASALVLVALVACANLLAVALSRRLLTRRLAL